MAVHLLRNTIRISSLTASKNVCLKSKPLNGRFIMTTRARLEKVLEDLRKNPYFDKYAAKIAKLQEADPEDFLERVERQEKIVQERIEKRERERKLYQSQAKPRLEQDTQQSEARLDNVMKVEMIEDKSREEITNIWKDYHKQKDCICGTMSPEQFDKMFERGKKYSTFLLPLPREQGYEFIVCQFSGQQVHMTTLLAYQTHKENAPECLTMVHYTELRDNKDLVLMRGEFDKNIINVQEAQCLANELQLYYCTDDPHRLQLVEKFTNKPDEFKHMDLIAQLETISLELANK